MTNEELDLEIASSMSLWYPKIRGLPIPQPKTEMVVVNHSEMWNLCDGKALSQETERELREASRSIGYPQFIRTDQASAKHDWKNAAFVENEGVLLDRIARTIEFNLCADIAGLPYNSMVFREYIPMDSKFTAFMGDMPVNPERRYFIRDGKVVAHYPYWIPDAIEQGSGLLPGNWKELSEKMNTETEEEIELLTKYAQMVAERFKGYWSVDFCKAKDGRWVLIDMARGERSWKPNNYEEKTINLDERKLRELGLGWHWVGSVRYVEWNLIKPILSELELKVKVDMEFVGKQAETIDKLQKEERMLKKEIKDWEHISEGKSKDIDDLKKVLQADNRKGLTLEKKRKTYKIKLVDAAVKLGLIRKGTTSTGFDYIEPNPNKKGDIQDEWEELEDWVNKQKEMHVTIKVNKKDFEEKGEENDKTHR